MKFNKVVKSFALTAGLLASFTSSAEFMDFQVDETPYGGSVLTADKFNGGYVEELVFNGSGFTTGAFATMSALYANEGTDVYKGSSSYLNFGYSVYAILTASGTSTSGTSFAATSASLQLYIDVNSDTTSDDLLAGTTLNNGDDILIATADDVTTAYGNYDFSAGTGNYNFDFTDFTLTTAGMDYFVSPAPFYSYLTVNGDYDSLSDLENITGDVSAVFQAVPVSVPEPSTVAVLALGLMGLGVSARRKNK